MAAPAREPASTLFTTSGNVTAPEGGRGELAADTASGTVITAVDAQSATRSAVRARTTSELRDLDTPHDTSIPKPAASADAVDLRAASSDETNSGLASPLDGGSVSTPQSNGGDSLQAAAAVGASLSTLRRVWDPPNLDRLPNEVLMQILGFLDVSDLLTTSRINHHFRTLSLAPILHTYRLQHVRAQLPPLLTSPSRPSLAELIARHIFLTHTTQISRRLARNLVAIRLSRRLPQRPSAETLVQRGVLPPECVPAGCYRGSSGGGGGAGPVVVVVAPALVARRRAVEKEKLKDGLRRWVGGVWRGEVKERSEGVRRWEERAGVGRVWRLRRFWERIGQADA
ncbi:putative F-box domain-containing protein [Rosellinia necatrix]|uniref:Putative F-box domain-containing protein n=1 Tax=Rosellinia necatrix TaxID=77044 RepID=A0A1W2TM75_ROSNE|nr:putative F-box domain-containing protein [Rosellinia necatrix]